MRYPLFITLLITFVSCFAQYTEQNSFIRQAIVSFHKDNNGFYVQEEGKMLDRVDGVIENYAYDSKAQNLYVLTETSNCVITLTKDYAKIIKKNKSIPQYKYAELASIVQEKSNQLISKMSTLNEQHREQLIEAQERAIADSIYLAQEYARQDSLIQIEKERKYTNYRKQHTNWQWFPIKRKNSSYRYIDSYTNELKCVLPDCDHICKRDSLLVKCISKDTICVIDLHEGELNTKYIQMHACIIPQDLASDPTYKLHLEAYSDSIPYTPIDHDYIQYLNSSQYLKYHDKVMQTAPYGYVEKWSWDNEYGPMSFSFTYRNLNKKTIKYMTIFWRVQNDVGDVRKTGSFKGTGPMKQYEAGTWDWDHSFYYVAGDASTMYITKIVITYMDGTSKVLGEKQIVYN